MLSANALQTNLVSDLPGVAQVTDPSLVNPWGISQGPGPLWISDNNSGLSTVYNGQGQPANPINPAGPALHVSIPTPGDPTGHSGTPDGTVFNSTFLTNDPRFMISNGTDSAPAIFLFATEDGTIVGWNPGVNPQGSDPTKAGTFGTIAVDNSGNNFTQSDPHKQTGAVYKGLTIATDANDNVYVADRNNRRVQVFDTEGNFKSKFSIDIPPPADAKPAIGNAPNLANYLTTGGTQTPGAPWAICITPGPNQVMYISDAMPGRLYKLSLDGKVLGWMGKAGKQLKQFGWIHQIACPSENEVYVAEILNWRVQKLMIKGEQRVER